MRGSRRLLAAIGTGSLAVLAACGSWSSSPHTEDPPTPDAGPPSPDTPSSAVITVAVTSPAPGAELVAAEHPSIVVTGTVATTDPAQGALEAWVNGVRVEIKDGAFTTALPPEIGINHIKVEGGNGGDLVAQELDVMWAPDYLAPAAGQTGFEVQGALELRLGQRFFDARLPGTTLDRSTDPVVARDLASALELILWHIDLASLLDGRIKVGQGSASLDIAIPAVTPHDITVDARIVDGAQPAIDLNIDLFGVFLAMNGSLTAGTGTLTIEGGVTADLHATARLTLGTAADGSIAVGITGITATVGALTPGFTGADGVKLTAVFAAVDGDFHALIEGLIGGLIPTFTDRLPPLLETLLGAADQLVNDIRFPLDIGFGTPVELQLDGRMTALDIQSGATNGHLTVREDLAVGTSGAAIHPTSRGAPQLELLAAAPVFDTAGVHLTMRQDLLNALLHALWNAGILEGQLALGGISATVSAKLPPVIRPTPLASPCKIDGERCDVLLQIGQLEVALPGFEQRFAINASAGARIEVNGGTVSLKIQMIPDVHVWNTSSTRGVLTPDLVRNLIETIVWPNLFGAIGDNLNIALPLPSLADLGLTDLAPGLANAQLVLQSRPRSIVSGGRIILGADLSLTTPPPP
jgi:hypothetical protein